MQRVLSAKNEETASYSSYLAGLLYITITRKTQTTSDISVKIFLRTPPLYLALYRFILTS